MKRNKEKTMKLPTKEQILKASEDCPDAKCVLEKLFKLILKLNYHLMMELPVFGFLGGQLAPKDQSMKTMAT